MDLSPPRPRIPRSFLPLGLLLAAAVCAAVYVPGLGGDFVFDDTPNIVVNTHLQVDTLTVDGLRQAVLSGDAGILKRPLSMLSFWLNYYTTGLDPFYFKLTNLLIHLVNGLALFYLTKLLLETARVREFATLTKSHRHWLALGIATIWLVHPLNLTAVLYVVQRMTSLSATFVILGLLCYVVGRRQLATGTSGLALIVFGLVGCGALAVLSKESGALLPLYMAAIEITLFRFEGLGTADARKLKLFFSLTVIAPAAAAVAYVLLNPDWILGGYTSRAFTLTERLLTEPRALWLYLRWTIVPTRGALSLFHDDVAVSRGLFDPATTFVALLGLAAVTVAAIRWRARAPLLAFAAIWFLAGHVMESSAIGLDLIYEHRNYLPTFGLLFVGVFLLSQAASRYGPKMGVAVPAALVLCFGSVTFARSQDWSNLYTLRMATVRDHPNSAAANYEAGAGVANVLVTHPEFVATDYERAKTYFERSASLDPKNVNAQFNLILLSFSTDHPIEEALLGDVTARLSGLAYNFRFVEALRSLVRWTGSGMAIPERTVLRLFEAALSNETVPARSRATMLSLLSGYYYSISNDQEAVSLALAAVQQDPTEPSLQIRLAELAIQLGNREVAAAALEVAEREDHLGQWALARQALTERLEQMRMAENSTENKEHPVIATGERQ